MASPKNAAPVSHGIGSKDVCDVDTSAFVAQNTGFAPYWSPEPGRQFVGRVIARDDRDAEFVRYLIQSEQGVIVCQSGPKDGAEEVIVRKGEKFNISNYAQLVPLFDECLASGLHPIVQVVAVNQVKTKTVGQTVWTFKFTVHPEHIKALEAYRASAYAMGHGNGVAKLMTERV